MEISTYMLLLFLVHYPKCEDERETERERELLKLETSKLMVLVDENDF